MLSVLTFRTPDEAVAKANNTPYGLSAGVWTEKGSRILWMAQRLRAGVVWANTFNRFDPTSPFGGYKESGFGREGGRHGLGRLPRTVERRLMAADRLDVRKTYKLYVGGAFPRSESGRSYEVVDAKGRFLANAALGVAQGRPRRGGGGPRRVRRLERRHRLQPGPGAVPGGRGAGGPARPVRRRGGRRPRADGRARADAAVDRRHRPVGLVRRLDRQDRPDRRVVEPGGRAVLQLLDARADRRGGRAGARRRRRCSAWCRWWRRSS